jgi:hypothetical protein
VYTVFNSFETLVLKPYIVIGFVNITAFFISSFKRYTLFDMLDIWLDIGYRYLK